MIRETIYRCYVDELALFHDKAMATTEQLSKLAGGPFKLGRSDDAILNRALTDPSSPNCDARQAQTTLPTTCCHS